MRSNLAATIKSVAEMAGVSIKTVSRELKKEGQGKPDTLPRVLGEEKALKIQQHTVAERRSAADG